MADLAEARLSLFFLIATLCPAFALGPNDPCQDDLHQYCRNAGDQIADCIRKNKEKFSPECLKMVERVNETMTARAKTKSACNEDARRFCRSLNIDLSDTTTRRLRDCLQGHYRSLSNACQTELSRQ